MIKLSNLLTEEGSQYTIYCDMDGVLTDFDKRYKDIVGVSVNKAETTRTPKEFWEPVTQAGVRFWAGMEWMHDGNVLWKYIQKYSPTLLTSPSRDKSSIIGKSVWCKKHLPNVKVIYSSHKYKYATPDSILIDDRKKNIDKWIQAGGIGILHTSAQDTLKQLKKLGL